MNTETEQAIDESGSALRRAAIAGDIETLHCLIDAGIPVDAPDSNGWTALMLAAKYGHTEAVQYLVKRGAEVNRRNKLSGTALHCGAQRGHPDVVRCLLKYRADVNERYASGGTPLIPAASHLEVLRILVAAGAEVNVVDNWGNSPLLHAVMMGSENCALFLLEHGAVIRLPHDQRRQNPITWAKLRKRDELVRRLEMAVVYDAETSEGRVGDEASRTDG